MTSAGLSDALDAALTFFLGCAAFFLRLFFLGLSVADEPDGSSEEVLAVVSVVVVVVVVIVVVVAVVVVVGGLHCLEKGK